MTGQIDIEVAAPGLRDSATLEAAIERAADVIYADFTRGGPCVAGNKATGTLSILLTVDDEGAAEWMPQLRVLCAAVAGPIGRVTVGTFVEAPAVD
jgi:hypothetical protein